MLQILGRFDHGDGEAGLDVPFDMAVEEPHTRIIGREAQHDVGLNVGHDGVPPQRAGGEVSVSGEGACIRAGALDDLKRMAVQMPWV